MEMNQVVSKQQTHGEYTKHTSKKRCQEYIDALIEHGVERSCESYCP